MTVLVELHKKIIQLPISLDDSMSIDHAVELTITGMPNALRLLENS